jgi:ketosteroid isomerase-like protein
VQDEAAIQRTITRYSQAASLGEWDEVLTTYLPDGVWEIPHLGMRFDGHAAIRGALSAFFETMEYVLQMNAPALIAIEGDTATARSAIRECGKSAGRDEGFEYLGLYVDRLVRTADGWKFAQRIFQGVGTHHFPLVPAQG